MSLIPRLTPPCSFTHQILILRSVSIWSSNPPSLRASFIKHRDRRHQLGQTQSFSVIALAAKRVENFKHSSPFPIIFKSSSVTQLNRTRVRTMESSQSSHCSQSSDMDVDGGESSSSQEKNSTSEVPAGDNVLIGVIQMCSTHSKEDNQKFCFDQIKLAKERGCLMVFLPEAFDYIGRSSEETLELAEPLDGPLIKSYQELAASQDIYISLGGFHQRQAYLRVDGKPFLSNTHVMIDDFGKILSTYDKIHMFDMLSPIDGVYLKESNTTSPGSEVKLPVHTPIGSVGLGICYDLRFPEFALKLRQLNAKVLTFPSAFTVPTGKAHWEILLRGRAVDNQCYVIAAAQVGKHNDKRSSYGHSMVVDPSGVVVAEAKDYDSLLVVPVSLTKVYAARDQLPVILNRRPSVYEIDSDQKLRLPLLKDGEDVFPFGHIQVKRYMAFLESEHSIAFVNRKCVVPGHVLVITKRPVPRMCDASSAEVADLFQLVRRVEEVMEAVEDASSTTICVQDGVDAGQTVKHVHVHVLPRQPMDFPSNDDIYQKLASHDKNEQIEWRSDANMKQEANSIRRFIHKHFTIMLSDIPAFDDVCTEETLSPDF